MRLVTVSLLIFFALKTIKAEQELPFIQVQPSIDYSDPEVIAAIQQFYDERNQQLSDEIDSGSGSLAKSTTTPCGQRIQPRIIGGSVAGVNEFPWQVALKIVVQINATHQGAGLCGGSLIGNKWVLTAAHCTDMTSGGYTTNAIIVMVGAHNISKTAQEDNRLDLNAVRWIEHPNWNPKILEHDLALIEIPPVARDALSGKQLIPVCLPFGITLQDENVDVIASGWGKVADALSTSPVLKYINTKTMTYSTCKFKSLLTTLYLKRSMLCIQTSSGTNNVCKGDSGGPLVKLMDGSYYHVGLTSFGSSSGCESSSDPSVFTRTKNYLSFICETTGVCQ